MLHAVCLSISFSSLCMVILYTIIIIIVLTLGLGGLFRNNFGNNR